MQDIRLIEAKEKHLDKIMQIENEAFSCPWTKTMMRHELLSPFSHYFCVLHKNTIVGYGGYEHTFDTANIQTIAIDSKYRRQGLAKLLMEYLLQHAQKNAVELVFLEVRKSNQSAIELYKGLGFEFVSCREGYYPDGEAAWIMVLAL